MGAINRALNKITDSIKVRGAMPGNKGRYDGSFFHDVTELEGLDNLQHPEGIIEESQNETRDIYNVGSARYLVNGSSSGNLTMIFSYFKEGDRVLVERNCHKSIFSGIILRKLDPVFLYPGKLKDGILYPVTSESIRNELKKDRSIKGVILTSPSYSGIVSDLEEIYKVTRKYDVPLLVDGAHGAHLKGLKGYDEYYRSCDSMVVSVHKTMNALNQASVLLNNRPDMDRRILEYSDMFQTTSPSYMIMESIELAAEDLKTDIFRKHEITDRIKNRKYSYLKVFHEKELRTDPWKINILGRGEKIYGKLIEYGIYPEMYNESSVLLMLSPYNTDDELKILEETLIEIDKEDLINKGVHEENHEYPRPVSAMSMHEAYESETDLKRIEESAGCISSALLVPYPPGIPLLMPGEVIDDKIIEKITGYIKENRMMPGITDGKIETVKGEK